MICTLTIQGYIRYKGIRELTPKDGKTKRAIYATIGTLVNGKWINFYVNAIDTVADAIIKSCPMDENYTPKQCILTCSLNPFWSSTKKKWLDRWQILTFAPIFTKKEELVDITGVDKDLESRADFSNIEEIYLGPSDNDWEV